MLAQWARVQREAWEVDGEARRLGIDCERAVDTVARHRLHHAELAAVLRRTRRASASAASFAAPAAGCSIAEGPPQGLDEAVGRDAARTWEAVMRALADAPQALTAAARAVCAQGREVLAHIAATRAEEPVASARGVQALDDLLGAEIDALLGHSPEQSADKQVVALLSEGSFLDSLLRRLTAHSPACAIWERRVLSPTVVEATAQLAPAERGAGVRRREVLGVRDRTMSAGALMDRSLSHPPPLRRLSSFLGEEVGTLGSPARMTALSEEVPTSPSESTGCSPLCAAASTLVSSLCASAAVAPVALCRLAAALCRHLARHGAGEPQSPARALPPAAYALLGGLLLSRWLVPALLAPGVGMDPNAGPGARAALTSFAKLLKAIASGAGPHHLQDADSPDAHAVSPAGGAPWQFVRDQQQRLRAGLFDVLVARGAATSADACPSETISWPTCVVCSKAELAALGEALAAAPAAPSVGLAAGLAPGALRALSGARLRAGAQPGDEEVVCWLERGALPPVPLLAAIRFDGGALEELAAGGGAAAAGPGAVELLALGVEPRPASRAGLQGDAGGTGGEEDASSEPLLLGSAPVPGQGRTGLGGERATAAQAAAVWIGSEGGAGDAGGTASLPHPARTGSIGGSSSSDAADFFSAASFRPASAGSFAVDPRRNAAAALQLEVMDFEAIMGLLWDILLRPQPLPWDASDSLVGALRARREEDDICSTGHLQLCGEFLDELLQADGAPSEPALLRAAAAAVEGVRGACATARRALSQMCAAERLLQHHGQELGGELRRRAALSTELRVAACLQALWSSSRSGQAAGVADAFEVCVVGPAAGGLFMQAVASARPALPVRDREHPPNGAGRRRSWLSSLWREPEGVQRHRSGLDYAPAPAGRPGTAVPRRSASMQPRARLCVQVCEKARCPFHRAAPAGAAAAATPEQIALLEGGLKHYSVHSLRQALQAMQQMPLEQALDPRDALEIGKAVQALVAITTGQVLARCGLDVRAHGQGSHRLSVAGPASDGPTSPPLPRPRDLVRVEEHQVGDQVASFVFGHLHSRLFPAEPTQEDLRLGVRISRLAWLRPKHLDVPAALAETPQAEEAVALLRTLHLRRSPGELLSVLAKAFAGVTAAACLRKQRLAAARRRRAPGGGSLRQPSVGTAAVEAEDAFGADESLPLFILVALKANPPMFASSLAYAERLTARAQMLTERGYALAQARAAATFAESVRREDLVGLEPGEWDQHMGAAGGPAGAGAGDDRRARR